MTELALLDAEIEALRNEAATLRDRLREIDGMIKFAEQFRAKISPGSVSAVPPTITTQGRLDIPGPVSPRSPGREYGVITGKILKCIGNGDAWHIRQIESATGLTNAQVRTGLKALKKQGRLEPAGDEGSGLYRITAKGLLRSTHK